MALDDLYAFLREEAATLEREFKKASISGRGTPQEVADFREHAVEEFVGRFFPFPHRVTKGKIRDSYGAISDSIDCVICNPNHPHTIDSHGKFQLIFAEGVDAAIEVKPDISNNDELLRGLQQGLTVKALKRTTEPLLERIPWMVERAHRVPYVILAMRCKKDPMDTGKEIVRFYKEHGTPPLHQADFIAVNNVGLFNNCIDASQYRWNKLPGDANKTGWFYEEWAEETLGGFLWLLQLVAHASIKMQNDILPSYLMPKAIHRVEKIEV